MLFLGLFSFLAGIVTILSPCILPVLPIVLSSSLGKGKERPLGVVSGFVFSFTFFTLFLTTIVRFFGIPADSLRLFSVFVVFFFGLSLLFPFVQAFLERGFAYFSRFVPRSERKEGFGGGFLIGISIGLLWTPCVGPILASVISLALTGNVSLSAVVITLSYALGTAIPMLFIVYFGQKVLLKRENLLKNTANIQKIFGVIMMLTAIAIYQNFDRKLQTYILEKFPSYGAGLIQLEENEKVRKELDSLNSDIDTKNFGKPVSEMMEQSLLAPEFVLGGKWFNLEGDNQTLRLKDLRGKVVLVDFWTYTCINCIRTLPYLRNWHDKYSDKGLVIVGVHSPEFEFEKSASNVQKAIADFSLKYPIMQDNDFATWRAYNNRYWPAKYLVDRNGKVRYTHFGEGAYDQTEKKIIELLGETGVDVSEMRVNNANYQLMARTPELYLGYDRIEHLVSPEKVAYDKPSDYSKPSVLAANKFAYGETWRIGAEYATPAKGSKLYLNFESKEVFLVMRPKEAEFGNVTVWVDGNVVTDEGGNDVINGSVKVDSDRLYKLINLENPGRHELMLEFNDSNLELYAFTFG